MQPVGLKPLLQLQLSVLVFFSPMLITQKDLLALHRRQGVQEYHMHNAFGALTSLANLQAIAAMQGAANLSGAGGAAALGSNLDFVGNMNRHVGLGGLGGLGINNSEISVHSCVNKSRGFPFSCPPAYSTCPACRCLLLQLLLMVCWF